MRHSGTVVSSVAVATATPPFHGRQFAQQHGQGRTEEADREHEIPGVDGTLAAIEKHRSDARIRRGEREERPTDPCARQEEQPVGREGQVYHHVEVPAPASSVLGSPAPHLSTPYPQLAPAPPALHPLPLLERRQIRRITSNLHLPSGYVPHSNYLLYHFSYITSFVNYCSKYEFRMEHSYKDDVLNNSLIFA